MKLHASLPAASHVFTAYGDDWVDVNGVRHVEPLVVSSERGVVAWDVAGFAALDEAAFARVAALDPELVLLGTGSRLRFVHPRLLAPLSARGIGVETMDAHAACRTYNILVAEGRRVAAALLLGAA